MVALLIIDMQAGGFKPETPRFDADSVINKINLLSEAIRESGNKVVFIQHDGTIENAFVPGTLDWEILSSIKVGSTDLVVRKTANDPFYQSALKEVLDDLKIMDLIIMGWATDFCVDTAVRSALSKDFNVIVVEDGHTTGNRPHLKAEQVIEHHNWIWKNMTPTKGAIKVAKLEEVIQDLTGEILFE